ncbi:MAG: ATP-binding protein, partial [Anaerolineae bacterium]|nr:ATP-binding protein [Anaerolineae bacterium]
GAMVTGQQIEQQSPLFNTLQMRGAGNIAVQTQNLQIPDQGSSLSDFDLGYLTDSSLQLGAQLETRIRILDTSGNILLDSDQNPGQEFDEGTILVEQALAGQYTSQTMEINGISTMSLAMPITFDGQLVGVIYLSHPLHDINAILSDMRMLWISSTAVALVLSSLVGLVLSGTITHPLHRLTLAAGAVAQGRFDQHVDIQSRDEMGQLSRAFNDMTSRLRAARHMQVDFVANVSHELRTPLTAIKGMVETLRAGAVSDISVRDRFLSTVESETDRMIRLVNDLLLLTRADSHALNLEREPLDIVQVVRKTVTRMETKAQRRGVEVVIHARHNPPLVWADRDRISQVILNLLDNAIKYAYKDGTVNIIIGQQDGETAWIQVQDQGIGISDEVLPRIGERFYRADKARARADGGSGLGLAIANTLVEAHGGRLWLESQEGKGTTAHITLPAA